MWECKKCKTEFVQPENRKIDAGRSEGILGYKRTKNILLFCPECSSLKIERKAG